MESRDSDGELNNKSEKGYRTFQNQEGRSEVRYGASEQKVGPKSTENNECHQKADCPNRSYMLSVTWRWELQPQSLSQRKGRQEMFL